MWGVKLLNLVYTSNYLWPHLYQHVDISHKISQHLWYTHFLIDVQDAVSTYCEIQKCLHVLMYIIIALSMFELQFACLKQCEYWRNWGWLKLRKCCSWFLHVGGHVPHAPDIGIFWVNFKNQRLFELRMIRSLLHKQVPAWFYNTLP